MITSKIVNKCLKRIVHEWRLVMVKSFCCRHTALKTIVECHNRCWQDLTKTLKMKTVNMGSSQLDMTNGDIQHFCIHFHFLGTSIICIAVIKHHVVIIWRGSGNCIFCLYLANVGMIIKIRYLQLSYYQHWWYFCTPINFSNISSCFLLINNNHDYNPF